MRNVLLGLCLLDWGVVDFTLFTTRPPESVLAEGRSLAQYLADIPGEFRIYSPSYSLPQQTAAAYRLQLADGVDPLQLQSYTAFMQSASGVPWTGYSVSVPPYSSGDPAHDNAAFQPDPIRLGWLNVRYLAADFDLPVEGLDLVADFGSTRLYENRRWMPRAWVQPSEVIPEKQSQPAEMVRWSPDRIELQSSGPGLLVVSEIAYPGWEVRVDGKKSQIVQVAGLLRGVRLEPGIHQIVFSFRPISVYIGLSVGTAALFLVLLHWFRQRDPDQ